MLIFVGLCLIFTSIIFQTLANADWHRQAREQSDFHWQKHFEILCNDRYVKIMHKVKEEVDSKVKANEKTTTL